MIQRALPAVLLFAAALTSAASDIHALQSPPMRLYGTVTIIGQPAAGAVIQALAGSAICGAGAVSSGGSYQLDVYTGPPYLCSDRALLSFTVGGRPARETMVAQPGAFVPLDLTVAAALPPPVPVFPVATTETVVLFPGCNNVVTTWPGTTPIGIVAGSVSPVDGLLAIWRYDAALARFLGFAPQAVNASDLSAVNRLDPVFICMSTPGTIARPVSAV